MIKMQQMWASFIGLASFTVGIISFSPGIRIDIPHFDGAIQLITGISFICGAWIMKGRYADKTNFGFGIFYMAFGVAELSWPHVIGGVFSLIISIIFKPAKTSWIK